MSRSPAARPIALRAAAAFGRRLGAALAGAGTRISMSARAPFLFAIRLYQRFLSPWKGYACAYRVHTGRASCSTLGYRAIRRRGVLAGLVLLRRRTYRCGVAHRRYHAMPPRPPLAQRGECDLSCAGARGGNCDARFGQAQNCCNLRGLCDCGGCGGGGPKGTTDDKAVYLPGRAGTSGPDEEAARTVGRSTATLEIGSGGPARGR